VVAEAPGSSERSGDSGPELDDQFLGGDIGHRLGLGPIDALPDDQQLLDLEVDHGRHHRIQPLAVDFQPPGSPIRNGTSFDRPRSAEARGAIRAILMS
jgi:hypothetical protein